jgi:hypothetical protein
VVICQELSKKYEGRPWILIKENDAWLRVMYMVLDSVEFASDGSRWARSAGFDEAWVVSCHPYPFHASGGQTKADIGKLQDIEDRPKRQFRASLS